MLEVLLLHRSTNCVEDTLKRNSLYRCKKGTVLTKEFSETAHMERNSSARDMYAYMYKSMFMVHVEGKIC